MFAHRLGPVTAPPAATAAPAATAFAAIAHLGPIIQAGIHFSGAGTRFQAHGHGGARRCRGLIGTFDAAFAAPIAPAVSALAPFRAAGVLAFTRRLGAALAARFRAVVLTAFAASRFVAAFASLALGLGGLAGFGTALTTGLATFA